MYFEQIREGQSYIDKRVEERRNLGLIKTIRKLGMMLILLVTLAVTLKSGDVLADSAGSKANIEFTEAWEPKDPEPKPDPKPDPTPNPPKKVITLPQTGENSLWQYSALGVLLIGAGMVIKFRMRKSEEF